MEYNILLDTNMLLAAVQFKAEWPQKAFTLSSCMDELEKIGLVDNPLKLQLSKQTMQARATLALVKIKKLNVVKTEKKGDSAIIDYAVRNKCAVATNDKLLIERLKKKSVKVYRLRQKKILIEA